MSTELRTGDHDDPIPALLEVRDEHGNRVDLLVGLRGLDPQAMSRTRQVAFADGALRVIGRDAAQAVEELLADPLTR